MSDGDIKNIMDGVACVGVAVGTIGLAYWGVIKPLARSADVFTDTRRRLEHEHWRKKWGINAPGIPLSGKEQK